MHHHINGLNKACFNFFYGEAILVGKWYKRPHSLVQLHHTYGAGGRKEGLSLLLRQCS
jgi:hypothetical protein